MRAYLNGRSISLKCRFDVLEHRRQPCALPECNMLLCDLCHSLAYPFHRMDRALRRIVRDHQVRSRGARGEDVVLVVLSGGVGCALGWSESDKGKIRHPKTHRLLRQHTVMETRHRYQCLRAAPMRSGGVQSTECMWILSRTYRNAIPLRQGKRQCLHRAYKFAYAGHAAAAGIR